MGRALLATGPFGDPERIINLARPMTVAEVIAEHDLAFHLPTIALMGGEPVMRGAWAERVVGPGEDLAFVAVPRGGGDSSGKQIVGLVAALALSVAAPFVGGFVSSAFFSGSTIAASIASAAFLPAGPILLNSEF